MSKGDSFKNINSFFVLNYIKNMNLSIAKFIVATVIVIAIANSVNAQANLGDKKDGGIVYWVNSSGSHGLIADVKDLSLYNWKDAISACREKGEGWHLPDLIELNKLYKNKDKAGGLYLYGGYYWSSDYEELEKGMGQNFSDGSTSQLNEAVVHHVRAVRTF